MEANIQPSRLKKLVLSYGIRAPFFARDIEESRSWVMLPAQSRPYEKQQQEFSRTERKGNRTKMFQGTDERAWEMYVSTIQ